VEAKLCTRFPAKSSTATTNQCKHPACASCLLALLSWHDILSTDSTMAEVTSLQKVCYALWEYDSTKRERSRLLPGCPFDDGDSDFYDKDDPDCMNDALNLAVSVLKKPNPTIEDFVSLFSVKIEKLYDFDDEVFKDVANESVGTLEKHVHDVLNRRSLTTRPYSTFRQLAINAATTDPVNLERFGPNAVTSHEAAVTVLGPLYCQKKAASPQSPPRLPPQSPPPSELLQAAQAKIRNPFHYKPRRVRRDNEASLQEESTAMGQYYR
jgi:hypothetical protein